MKSLDDVALIDLAYRNDDQRAYAELVSRHQSALRYSLRQLCNWDEALADDLVQETFIQAFKKLYTFTHQSKFSSWIYRIAYNVFLQHQRKPSLQTISVDDATNDIQNVLSSDQSLGDDGLSIHKKLAMLLSTISPQRRSVLHLYLHRQCTQQEISIMMGIPLGSVKTHILRGRKELQDALIAYNGEHDE